MSDSISVLCVDNDPSFLQTTAASLERENPRFRVLTERNAHDALERLQGDPGAIDCVVSDYELPGLNGIELLRTIQDRFPDSPTPFVLLTGTGSEEIAADALNAGASSYVRKGNSEVYEYVAKRIDHDLRAARNRRDRKRFDAFVGAINDPVYVLDEEGRFTYVNDALVDLVGYEREEILGERPQMIKDGTGVETGEEQLRRLLSADGPDSVTFEIQIRRKDGETIVCEDHMGLLPYDGDEFRGSLGVLRDVSERKRRKRAINALHRTTRELIAADSAEDIADIIADAATDLLGLSNTTVHFYDDDQDALVPVAWTDTIDEAIGEPPVLDRDSLAWKCFEDGTQRAYSDLDEQPDVRNEPTPAGSELIAPLDTYGVVIAASTERDAFEEYDRRLLTVLCENAAVALDRVTRERLLRDRERELERQNERLEEFAGVVSHDLRNPLSVASGRLTLLREECNSEEIEPIENALDRMKRIIQDVLWLAREGRNIGETGPVDLEEAIESAWTIAADGRDDAELRLSPSGSEGLPTVEADVDRLRQLLENLFRNALEHAGKDVTVTAGVLDDGFYIEDDGPGIVATERDSVFEAGYSTDEDGTGFGLRIVEQVADAHGWDVRLGESNDGGARFEIVGVERIAD